MTERDQDDLVLHMLSKLPAGTPDAVRSERVLARCHKAMRSQARMDARRGVARRIMEPVVVGAVSVVYFVGIVRDALRAYRVF